MPYAAVKITSYANRNRVYADINDELNIISQNGHVFIVEGKYGRFSVTAERLSEEMVALADEAKPERKRLESRKPLTQAEKLQLEYLNSLK